MPCEATPIVHVGFSAKSVRKYLDRLQQEGVYEPDTYLQAASKRVLLHISPAQLLEWLNTCLNKDYFLVGTDDQLSAIEDRTDLAFDLSPESASEWSKVKDRLWELYADVDLLGIRERITDPLIDLVDYCMMVAAGDRVCMDPDYRRRLVYSSSSSSDSSSIGIGKSPKWVGLIGALYSLEPGFRRAFPATRHWTAEDEKERLALGTLDLSKKKKATELSCLEDNFLFDLSGTSQHHNIGSLTSAHVSMDYRPDVSKPKLRNLPEFITRYTVRDCDGALQKAAKQVLDQAYALCAQDIATLKEFEKLERMFGVKLEAQVEPKLPKPLEQEGLLPFCVVDPSGKTQVKYGTGLVQISQKIPDDMDPDKARAIMRDPYFAGWCKTPDGKHMQVSYN